MTTSTLLSQALWKICFLAPSMYWYPGYPFHGAKFYFLKRKVTPKEDWGKAACRNAVAKGSRILGGSQRNSKRVPDSCRERPGWPGLLRLDKQPGSCVYWSHLPFIYYIFPSQLISLHSPSLSWHAEWNLTLRPGSTSFLSTGHLGRA